VSKTKDLTYVFNRENRWTHMAIEEKPVPQNLLRQVNEPLPPQPFTHKKNQLLLLTDKCHKDDIIDFTPEWFWIEVWRKV